MLRGFYTAASGVLMQERTLNVLTNNLVNARTPGFRASRVVSTTFEDEYLVRLEKGASGAIGTGAPVRIVSDVPTLFDPSSLEETGRPYDLAINGEGFFNILTTDAQGNERQYLTRNGNFDVDEEGMLVLRGHGQVLGEKDLFSLIRLILLSITTVIFIMKKASWSIRFLSQSRRRTRSLRWMQTECIRRRT